MSSYKARSGFITDAPIQLPLLPPVLFERNYFKFLEFLIEVSQAFLMGHISAAA